MRIPVLSLALPALFLCLPLPAQTKPAPEPTVTLSADEYGAESYVVERYETVYAMNADGTGTRTRTMAIRVQSEAALRSLGVIGIPFASASEKVEFQYVRVRRPNGTVVDTPLTDAQEQPEPVTREAPFYSDLKQKQLPVKSLRVGDTLEWQVKIVRTKAEAANEFWGQESFTENAVILAEAVELRVPASKTVKVWTNPAGDVKPVERVEGDQRVYRWEHASLKPTAGPAAEAAKKLKEKTPLTPAEELDRKEGSLPTIAWTTFPNWEAVGAWYRGLEGTRMQPDETVKAKVAEITAGKKTDEEKVRAVYAYVSTNVRYIGVALGIGRYQPHHAEEVMENQYGDCKDKHTLLAAMLTVLGLHPDAVLIGAGVRFNDTVPSPSAFNHLITRVQVAGQPVWLDTTAEVAPYRMLSLVIRDKQALIVPETGASQLARTPADAPFPSFVTMTAKGTLDAEGTSNSHLVLTVRGDEELIVRSVVHQVAPAQYSELVQRMAHGMGYGGTTSHAEISRPEDTAGPLVMQYDYNRDKAGDWANLKTVPQLYPLALPMVDEKKPPIAAIQLGYPHTEQSNSEMKLPDGWGAILPDAVHEKTAFATYDSTYKLTDGTLYAERKVSILTKEIPQKDWKSYLKWQEEVGLGGEPYVQLVRNGVKPPAPTSTAKNGALPPVSTDDKAKAAELVQQAVETMKKKPANMADPQQQNEIARVLLKRAENLDEHALGLWAAYAAIEVSQHNYVDSVKNYQKELGFHPDEYAVYQSLASTQLQARSRLDAMGTYKTWAKADPSDPTPIVRMMNMMLTDGDAAGAVTLSETALPKLPEDKRKDGALQYALAQAQLKAGMTAKGEATLLALLGSTDDLSRKNDVAYTLADANLQLPLAETTEREVLAKLTAETAAWTMDEGDPALLRRSSLLVACWDTMGWIYFREGKLAEAESYLKAAWLNSPRVTLGQHLADLKAAKGDRNGALELYQYMNVSVKRTQPTGSKELDERIAKMFAEGAKETPLNIISARLSTQHRIPLGPSDGLRGSAEYRLLIGRIGLLWAGPAGEKSLPNGLEHLRKAKLEQFFPAGSDARMVRKGIMFCNPGGCELGLE